MKIGDRDGLDAIYDEEAQLILSNRERLYGRRGLTIDAYEVSLLTRKPLFVDSLYMVFYTNQRIVGLRDMTEKEKEQYLGTLSPIDRAKLVGSLGEEHHVLSYVEYPLMEITRVSKVGTKYLRLMVGSDDRSYEFRYRPWGAACRFFSILLRKEEQK
ncbi:MAG: hypothetical protein LN412_01460 [Candidatus Thermoplasmatota archaeon]|nr:hypothetical protein [Candidatus Thermoplasmatota archaeon]